MRIIKITAPKTKEEKWRVSFGKGSPQRKKAATFVYNAVERRLLASRNKEKTVIVVKYTKDTSNESCLATNPYYLLSVLACFLEDYLTEAFVNSKEKKYRNRGQNPLEGGGDKNAKY